MENSFAEVVLKFPLKLKTIITKESNLSPGEGKQACGHKPNYDYLIETTFYAVSASYPHPDNMERSYLISGGFCFEVSLSHDSLEGRIEECR